MRWYATHVPCKTPVPSKRKIKVKTIKNSVEKSVRQYMLLSVYLDFDNTIVVAEWIFEYVHYLLIKRVREAKRIRFVSIFIQYVISLGIIGNILLAQLSSWGLSSTNLSSLVAPSTVPHSRFISLIHAFICFEYKRSRSLIQLVYNFL